jgi:pimeloyl-ACP methyl ester carboxylesterase
MQRFSSDGVEIAFVDEGEGDPILLIHGFASNLGVNWRATGWIDFLKRDGRRVIAFDVRGHGESAKLYAEDDYRMEKLSRDARNLLDHLGLRRADVMGYSMGARITTWLALDHPTYVRSAIIGGMGLALVEGIGGEEEIAAALEAPDIALVKDPTAWGYRKFAEATASDLKALAACIRVQRQSVPAERLAELNLPVLVAVGENDRVAGSPGGLARLIPGAELCVIPRRDHMLATGDRAFKERVLEFLRSQGSRIR